MLRDMEPLAVGRAQWRSWSFNTAYPQHAFCNAQWQAQSARVVFAFFRRCVAWHLLPARWAVRAEGRQPCQLEEGSCGTSWQNVLPGSIH